MDSGADHLWFAVVAVVTDAGVCGGGDAKQCSEGLGLSLVILGQVDHRFSARARGCNAA